MTSPSSARSSALRRGVILLGVTLMTLTGLARAIPASADTQPTISIDDVAVAEGDAGTSTNAVFTVSLSDPATQAVTVNWTTADGTAKTGEPDYQAASGTVAFNVGSDSKQILVPVIGDDVYENDETFNVKLSSPTNATIADDTGIGTITNDDDPPVVKIDSASKSEGDAGTSQMDFTVTRTGKTEKDVTVHWATANGSTPATAASTPDDYVGTSGDITFPASTNQTETDKASVTINGDTIPEPNETFTVTLSSPLNATLDGAHTIATGTINDDDATHLGISIDDVSVVEGNSPSTVTATFHVTLVPTATQTYPVSATYATQDVANQASSSPPSPDYVSSTGPVVWTDATAAKTQTVSVTVVGDATDEIDEIYHVVLSNASGAALNRDTGTGTIIDDDGPTVSIGDVSQPEGDSGNTNMNFTVRLSAASPQDVYVDYSTQDGTAQAGSDYTASAGPPLHFAPQETQKTLPISIIGDTLRENDETFSVTLSNPVNATIGTGAGTGTIQTDDGRPQLDINNVSVVEGNTGSTNAVFTVTLTGSPAIPPTVDWSTADGSAVEPGDYTFESGTLDFTSGPTQTISVPVLGDTSQEGNETFTVNLSNPQEAVIGAGTGTGTILDDDGPAFLVISDATTTEGDSGTKAMTFTVSRTGNTAKSVSVHYATADGSATAGTDYQATSGNLNFAAGESSKSVDVNIIGDTTPESTETFTVVLSSASGASISDSTGVGTIIDNDQMAQGYSLVGSDGSLYAFGTAKNLGDMRGTKLNAPVIGVAYAPGGAGYWLVAKDGGIFTFGSAKFFGSMGAKPLNSPVIGMAATPSGNGYWLFAGDGGIFSFGDAKFFGSMGDKKLNAPVVNMEPVASGGGYWLVAADGGIFSFNAKFFGSMGDQHINQPVFDMTSTDTDQGYWLVARDGGVFSFGDAAPKFYGSAVNSTPAPTKIIGMDSTPDSLGYWVADADGKVYHFGDAQDLGDRYASVNPAPMVAFAAVPA